jgi:hypothetical protein
VHRFLRRSFPVWHTLPSSVGSCNESPIGESRLCRSSRRKRCGHLPGMQGFYTSITRIHPT